MSFSASINFKAIDNLTAPIKRMSQATSSFAHSASASFSKASASMNDFAGKTLSRLDKVNSKASTTRSVFEGIIGANLLQSGVSGLIQFGKEGLKLASDLTEVQNVVDTTFRANSAAIDEWAKKSPAQFGVSTLQAKQFTGTLGAMMKSSGMASGRLVKMSTDMVGLAGDMASFYNLPVEEAFEKIRSGISGETEPLKQLGINMSVANLSAYAMSKGIGKSYDKMTQAEQMQLRYNYLMKVSKDAQGDFSKTLETSAANQARVMEMQKKALAADLMTKLLPSQINMYTKLNEIFGWLIKNVSWLAVVIKMVAGVLVLMAAKYILVKTAIMVLTAYQYAYSAALAISYIATGKMSLGLLANANALKIVTIWEIAGAAAQWLFNASLYGCPIVWIIAGILAIIAVVVLMIVYWKQIKETIDKFSNSAVFQILALAMPILKILELISFIQDRWEGLKQAFTFGFFNGLKEVGKMLLNFVLKPLEVILNTIGKVTGANWAKNAAKGLGDFRMGLDNNLIAKQQPYKQGEQPNYVEKPVNKDATIMTYKKLTETNSKQNVQITIDDMMGRASVNGDTSPIPVIVNSTRRM